MGTRVRLSASYTEDDAAGTAGELVPGSGSLGDAAGTTGELVPCSGSFGV